MKKILLVRNADFDYHASFYRTLDALTTFELSKGNQESGTIYIINRKRISGNTNERSSFSYIKKEKTFNGVDIVLYTFVTKEGRNFAKRTKNLFFYTLFLRKTVCELGKLDLAYVYDLDSAYPIISNLKKNKVPVIYHIADFYPDSRIYRLTKRKGFLYKLFWAMERKIISFSKKTIICTEKRKEQMGELYSEEKMEVVHNTPVLSEFNILKKNEDNKQQSKFDLVVGYVGTLSSERFIDKLLTLFVENSNLKLLIAGHGPLTEMVEKTSKNHENILFFGKVHYKTSLSIYLNSDFIWGAYDYNGLNTRYSAPNKFYESLVTKKPLIVLKGTGVDELVNTYKTGYIFETIDEIEGFLLEGLPADYNVKKKNCFKVYPLYSWENQREKIYRIMEEIFDGK